MAEGASQFETPLSIQEKDKLLCPKCGVLFELSGYKVEKVEITAWKQVHSGERRDETQKMEPMLEVDLISGH